MTTYRETEAPERARGRKKGRKRFRLPALLCLILAAVLCWVWLAGGETLPPAASMEYGWLAEHAWEYGFIRRYPPDKTDITGISNEPWHYRYVGREAAADMRELGICLEEYIDYLNQE